MANDSASAPSAPAPEPKSERKPFSKPEPSAPALEPMPPLPASPKGKVEMKDGTVIEHN
jgi:hypothetical protein